MRNGTPHIASLCRTLATLEAVVEDGGRSNVSALARAIDMPVATAHRQVSTLVAEGYLKPCGGGRHIAGPRLLGLMHRLDEKQVIANVAAPFLHRLAGDLRTVVQLGTLENDMVTYRIKTGEGAGSLFTRIDMQLEAYCSGIGKVLLAYLPQDQRAAYVATGPFVPLTARTIIDPTLLAMELAAAKDQGFAIDDGEIADDLRCMAVPICHPDGRVLASISVSQSGPPFRHPDEYLLERLKMAAVDIERAAFS
ncbi:MAG: IclR family transcriptional regulator [Sphingomonadales bacterium]|nr:IclR family transcriptional regulator [Sphingomonadales bacterium]